MNSLSFLFDGIYICVNIQWNIKNTKQIEHFSFTWLETPIFYSMIYDSSMSLSYFHLLLLAFYIFDLLKDIAKFSIWIAFL